MNPYAQGAADFESAASAIPPLRHRKREPYPIPPSPASPIFSQLSRKTILESTTSNKERQKRISGWLARYDFARPIQTWLWSAAKATIRRDTVIALSPVIRQYAVRSAASMTPPVTPGTATPLFRQSANIRRIPVPHFSMMAIL